MESIWPRDGSGDDYGNGYGAEDCSAWDHSFGSIWGDGRVHEVGAGHGQSNGCGVGCIEYSNGNGGSENDKIHEVVSYLVPASVVHIFNISDKPWTETLTHAVAYYKAKTQEEKDSIIGMLELKGDRP